jgi:hypothetical protein
MFNPSDAGGGQGDVIGYGDRSEPAAQFADPSTPTSRVAGVDVRSLPRGAELMVDTCHSRYHFVMLDGSGSSAMVQGGRYFLEETEARIDGSALGGSPLKVGWIGLGQFLEMSAGGRRITTSRVRSISVEPNPVLTLSEMLVS